MVLGSRNHIFVAAKIPHCINIDILIIFTRHKIAVKCLMLRGKKSCYTELQCALSYSFINVHLLLIFFAFAVTGSGVIKLVFGNQGPGSLRWRKSRAATVLLRVDITHLVLECQRENPGVSPAKGMKDKMEVYMAFPTTITYRKHTDVSILQLNDSVCGMTPCTWRPLAHVSERRW